MRKLFTLIAVSLFAMAGMAQVVFTETFSGCNGTGGNDGTWSGGGTASSGYKPDNTGGTQSNARGARECAKFGTGTKKGEYGTPSISLTGDATLTFKAGGWDGDSNKGLTITATGATIANGTVTIPNAAWGTFSVAVTGATGSVKITIAAEKTQNNRFFLDDIKVEKTTTPTTETISITNLGYATYFGSKTLAFPAEVTPYYVVKDGGNVKLVQAESQVVGANSPVVLKANEGSYTATVSTETPATLTNNILKGVFTQTEVTATAGNKIYILNNGANGAGFYWQKDSNEGDKATVPAGRCYLDVAITGAAGAQGLSFESLLTGIQTVEKVSNSADIYDLAGRRVQQVGRGLYIVDGKKVIR